MTTPLPQSAQRVQDFLREHGLDCTVMQLPGSTRTAAEAAEQAGCTVGEIAKSLIFKDTHSEQAILIIASGANRVDLARVEKATGYKLQRAEGKWVKETVGFAIGGIPPVGHNLTLPTLLDIDLQQYQTIWAAAGTPFAIFQIQVAALQPLTGGRWLELAEESKKQS